MRKSVRAWRRAGKIAAFMNEYIESPEEYLNRHYPDKRFIKVEGRSIGDENIPPYIIRENNGCVINAAACILAYALKAQNRRLDTLKPCRSIAERLFRKARRNDYYVPLGRTSHFLNSCAKFLGISGSAKSSIFARRNAVFEINSGRPVFLNIAYSRQYKDHTVIAYGWERYRIKGRGSRSILFFKIRDGYSKDTRYLVWKNVFGVFSTSFVL